MDTTNSSIINNTIVSNDSTATAGAAFPASATRTSRPQPAGISSEPHSPALAGVANTRFSNPTLTDNIIFQNRSFYFSADQQTSGTVAAATHLYPAFTTAELAPSTSRYSCPGGATYWDLGLVNDPDRPPTRMAPAQSDLLGTEQLESDRRRPVRNHQQGWNHQHVGEAILQRSALQSWNAGCGYRSAGSAAAIHHAGCGYRG